ncbi:type IV pilus biogenesis protein PilM [Fervidibacillus halotolerans]|uniref:Pilus assembly protein PilM n=1 Tax=Fervidibacillus halotolerans TaxID=2980027 RepID=A0A9E8RXJ7_9BACI|nr:pilus assembly protein PilM [Fervidibacillus halotolerans]WAA12840.1 pilus assembly protein PilM [Fervidibacillus halotolerans]
MLKLLSNNKIIHFVVDDYAIRMVEYAGGGLEKIKQYKEKSIPAGLIEHGRIVHELEFYEFIKALTEEWGIKRRKVQFYVPDSLIIMKKESYPAHLKKEELKGHFYMELGQSLYLPFDSPIFDVHPLLKEGEDSEKREAILFAAPEDEIQKYAQIFQDAGLQPVVADIRPIGIYRYYKEIHREFDGKSSILFFEVNLHSIMISIFSDDTPEFLRYIELNVPIKEWTYLERDNGQFRWNYTGDEEQLFGLINDQLMELERIMNFYRYSLHKGEKMIDKIVLLGDFPTLQPIFEKMETNFSIPIEMITPFLPSISRSFIPALGLALRGEVK